MYSQSHLLNAYGVAMTPQQWPAKLTAHIAQGVRHARRAAGLTMARVAQGCADRGMPEISEHSLKNLESGRKTSLSVADLFVLADVLGVPPITLLFPLGSLGTVEVLPGRVVSTWDALAWFTGELPAGEPAPEGSAKAVLDVFRHHSDLTAAAVIARNLAKDRRRAANATLDKERRKALLARAAGYEEQAFEDCRELRTFRELMRNRELVPPALPKELAFVDDAEQETGSVNPPSPPAPR